MTDGTINFNVWWPSRSVKDKNCSITCTGDKFIVVKMCVEPTTNFDEVIASEWCLNMPQIFMNNNTLQILNSEFFIIYIYKTKVFQKQLRFVNTKLY